MWLQIQGSLSAHLQYYCTTIIIMDILKKNLFPAHLIERVINRHTTGTQSNLVPIVPFPPLQLCFPTLRPHLGGSLRTGHWAN